ncbi:MAG: class I SAM-dependent methyltransferase, partial [Novosphingobium sp.]
EGREVTALEPSAEMIAQRRIPAARVVQGKAEALPFGDAGFDAAMAVLTVHHWADQAKGLGEMRRVTRGPIVILTFDAFHGGLWLTDYFPQLAVLDRRQMPDMTEYARWLGPVRIEPVPIPHDCTDGFLAAYWRRPAAYLDPRIRKAISSFWMIGDLAEGLARLESDLESGAWHERHAGLLEKDSLDCGYRLVMAE